GAYRVGFSMAKTEQRVAELRKQIIGAMLIMLVLCCVTIIFVVSMLVRPLDSLTWSAKRIAAGNYDEEIPVASDDENGTVAAAFN
ncbi:MAG: HAMP domain-containing protein, partial [Geobacter sp.]|nr:HAMP domain-containing protein [Geobacter sp.]